MSQDVLKFQPAWLDAQCPRMGRYVLGPLLGKGGMGEVVEAWDVVLCRTVALKILRNLDPTAMIRFMHEAQVHARVVHPNICRIYDVDAVEGTVKIAMQLVRGPNLEHASPDLTIPEVVTLVAQVAEAVHAAHRLKLIHRDLKPSNILLERGSDGRWIPYICDFGLAMAMDEPALTFPHGVVGTPAYMAPEQFRGDRAEIGPPTDVFGLGGTLHYLLMGRAPTSPTPSGADPVEEASPEALSFRGDLPRDLKTIIRKCLQFEPALRYPSAASLAEDLWRFVNDEPVHATLPGPLGRMWRRGHRHFRLVLTLAATLGALGVGWVAGSTTQANTMADQRALALPFALEALTLEKDFALERALPIHDLRPARGHLNARMEALRSEMRSLGPAAKGPGHLALGRANLLLRNFAGARLEAEKAWAAGLRGPETCQLLALSLASQAVWKPAGSPDLRELEALFQRGKGFASDSGLYGECLTAFLHVDYEKAARTGQAAFHLHPWLGDAAALGGLSLCTLAQLSLDRGELAGARARYEEAKVFALKALPYGQSDDWIHHAYFLAARGLAAMEWDRGSLSLETLAALQVQCDQALQLDPASPELQEDWLGLRLLKALRQMDLGLDPGAALDAAMIFQGTRLKEPLSAPLQADRVAIYWLQAERSFQRGEDPLPALAEALKLASPGPFLARNLRAEVLNFKARLELARGEDPTATVEACLAHLEPALRERPSWAVTQAAAEAWFLRAEWEAAHRRDAAASLQKAQALIDATLQINPGSAAGFALSGLTLMLEGRVSPQKRPSLVMLARERLRLSESLSPVGRHQARLRQVLKGL